MPEMHEIRSCSVLIKVTKFPVESKGRPLFLTRECAKHNRRVGAVCGGQWKLHGSTIIFSEMDWEQVNLGSRTS